MGRGARADLGHAPAPPGKFGALRRAPLGGASAAGWAGAHGGADLLPGPRAGGADQRPRTPHRTEPHRTAKSGPRCMPRPWGGRLDCLHPAAQIRGK